MSLVEKELTMKNIERARTNPELEKYKETEHKLTPLQPEVLDHLKAEALPIEQIYLSTPADEFSLRVRCVYTPEGQKYTATQKDRGDTESGALTRSEVETDISSEAFAFYKALDFPTVYKLRAKAEKGLTVDFYDNPAEPVIVEVEHSDPTERARLLTVAQRLSNNGLVDRSSDESLTNEAIAYKNADGSERQWKTPESLDSFTHRVSKEMIAQYVAGKNQVVVGLTGMSGSGKTTVTNAVQEQIVELFGESYRPIIVSTDDYHFGKAKLEETYGAPYTEWDHPRTYNTEELAIDLERLAEGYPLVKRHFDFASEEVIFEETTEMSPFVIVEGLYAASKDLDKVRDLHFTLPTGIATSVGRDVRRLVIDGRANRAFPTPESRLRHQIENAIPAYLEHQRNIRNTFSASTRPIGERAFMLAKVRALEQ
jgi:uridine kinase